MAEIAKIELPRFGGLDEDLPALPVGEYESRLAATIDRMAGAGLDILAVYADRAHSANIAFLSGFDARFEEALLLLDRSGARKLLVGNECMGYLPEAALKIETELFQDFSLMGQPRGDSRPLRRILADFGAAAGCSIGTIGWKYFGGELIDAAETAIEIPAYIVDLLRDMAGEGGSVRNAGALLSGAVDGLRLFNSADQIARFEFAAVRTSESVRAGVEGVREGVSEAELEALLRGDGLTRSCHPMISFGEKVQRGLSSPSGVRAKLGDAFVVAYGIAGALNCRAGVVAHGPDDLPAELREFYAAFAANYFDVVAAWYRRIRIGVTAGDVFAAAEEARDGELYDFAVNPGHYIHLEEWVNSPFAAGDATELASGMAIQMDIIPVSRGPFCYSNAEDGIALADEALRAELAQRFPACWTRIEGRRRFLADTIGIGLHETVLPLSNIPGWLAPYVLEPNNAFVLG